MLSTHQEFLKASELKAFDKKHREIINHNINKYDIAVEKGKMQYANINLAKERAAHIKHKTIEDLDKYLVEFEANFITRGGKVIWAETQEDAIKEILQIMQKGDVRKVVKSKSMITEEIALNERLQNKKIEVTETDLGEFIVQTTGEKPYHIITPVMHKSKEDVALVFNEKYGLSKEAKPEEIAQFVRGLLREKFISADVGITGANFLIADIGGLAITENEGNALMGVSFPNVIIAIAGIDKMIPSFKDLDLYWPLLATHGTGQKMTSYNTILTGPRQENETDGPLEMYVVIIDNNRSNVLNQVNQRRALSCIKCGACLNACPIYKNIGGHAYGTVYSGPIGAVITPFLKDIESYKHLSEASTLCGKCTEVCPVKINLHKQLLYNRRDFVKAGFVSKNEKFVMYLWKKAMLNRWILEKASIKTKNFLLRKYVAKQWGKRRFLPLITSKSFNTLWKEQRGIKK